jgi:hypothetical protein
MTQTYQGYAVTTANADLPITMEMVRAHLRLDDITSEDALVQSYLLAAASYVEKTSRKRSRNTTLAFRMMTTRVSTCVYRR